MLMASSDTRLLQGDDDDDDDQQQQQPQDEEDGDHAVNVTLTKGGVVAQLFTSSLSSSSPYYRDEYDLAAAFRMMAATKSPDKEHGTTGAGFMGSRSSSSGGAAAGDTAFLRDDSQVIAMATAQAIEKRVVELISTIGRLVIHAPPEEEEQDGRASHDPRNASIVRSDAIFEYFCEKSMLSLLVDIAKEKRQESEEGRRWGAETAFFHGVVWSPKVKAQIFATMAALISESRNPSVIYYLLSNNYVNSLIDSMLPLQQWTDQALSQMMPPYVDMLQKVAVQLAADPHLFPFLTRREGPFQEDELDPDSSEEQVVFPLYSAALETATGVFAQSDSVVYGTSLVAAVNIMQINFEPIQRWVCNAGSQQRILADHLCQRLVDRYYRVVNLTTGPVVDGLRSHAIANQLSGLKDHLTMIHEVFWSGVRGLDVRLCESLLQRVVTVLLKNLVPHRRRPFLAGVGFSDSDVIPEQEALAQVSTIFLTFLFSKLAYVPFQRMLAVALFHEKSTPLFASQRWMQELDSSSLENYIFMPLLSDIVTGENDRETGPNLFRLEIIKGLSGEYGEWRATACACLFQAALKSDSMDEASLKLLRIVPSKLGDEYQPMPLEEAIATYLTRKHKPSAIAMETLEYVGFLAIQIVEKTIAVHCMEKVKAEADHVERVQAVANQVELVLTSSSVWKAMLQARSYFATEALKCQQITGVSDIFMDMIESVVQSRYTARYDASGWASHRCPLSQRGCAATSMGSELMIRRMRSVSPNDVESVRFFLAATLHMRALGKAIDRFCLLMKSHSKKKTPSISGQWPSLDLVEIADELTCTIGGLAMRKQVNTDIDLTGRMTFPFQPAIDPMEYSLDATATTTISPSPSKKLVRIRSLLSTREPLLLVLDPTSMFVVRPQQLQQSGVDENRATVVYSISLRSVIAAAEDGEWLHVAVRPGGSGGVDGDEDDCSGGHYYLIKNGNMALRLETNGSCLIVKQFLDRSRESLRQELMDKVGIFLQEAGALALDCPSEEKKTLD